jgi:peptidoglycan/LPS O-acetylase OafA/YrhL
MHWYWFGFMKLHILTISLLILTPLSVAFAWLFFRVCERPFMTVHGRTTRATPKIEDNITLVREAA